MSLTAGKRRKSFHTDAPLNVGVLTAVVCFQGGIAMLSGGYARPARTGQGGNDFAKMADVANSRVIGVFDQSVTGGATDGAVTVDVFEGTWLFKNSAGVDAITVAEIDRYCFIVDDETVAGNSAGGTRLGAGIVREVSSEGVWV